MANEFQVGDHCLIVAEIGINHNGNLDLAKKSILAAKDAGADGVKFQNYNTEDFISDRTLSYTYISQGLEVTENQWDMFKRYELSRDNLFELAAFCRENAIMFGSTPTNAQGVADLLAAGASFVKIGSDYLCHLPLLAEMARCGLPLVISCGMASLGEIDDAVRKVRENDCEKPLLLHCISAYPTPESDVNLRKIFTLRQAFGCPAGFSDHTQGITAAIGAAVLGANMVEKHFTLDKNLPGPDHRFSSDPVELAQLVSAVHSVEQQLGSAAISPAESELESRRKYRLSCVAACDLPKGHRLMKEDIAFRRPGDGLAPKLTPLLIGKILDTPVKKGELLKP